MVLPDKRFCFDYFRPLSTTGDFLRAFIEGARQPSPWQIFEQKSLGAAFWVNQSQFVFGRKMSDDPAAVHPTGNLEFEFSELMRRLTSDSEHYEDTHCWTFTPSSFELILNDINQVCLTKLKVDEIKSFEEGEFVAHLRKTENILSSEEFINRRKKLLSDIISECAMSEPLYWAANQMRTGFEPSTV